MISAAKAFLRKTPLYTHRFARQQAALVHQWSDADDRRAQFYSQFVQAGSLVFDIGANVGHHVKTFLHLRCRVVAVEPQKLGVASLKRAFGNRIDIVQAAISDHIGTAELRLVDGAHQQASLSPEWISSVKKSGRLSFLNWDMRQHVKTRTLDSLIDQYGMPAFIKIDTQGYEREVLSGLSQIVQSLNFEFTPEYLDPGLACVDVLSCLGAYGFNYSFGDGSRLEFQHWRTADEIKTFMLGLHSNNQSVGDVYARVTKTPALPGSRE